MSVNLRINGYRRKSPFLILKPVGLALIVAALLVFSEYRWDTDQVMLRSILLALSYGLEGMIFGAKIVAVVLVIGLPLLAIWKILDFRRQARRPIRRRRSR